MKRKRRKARVHDILVPLDMTALAADPRDALEESLEGMKRPKEFLLTVHGIERKAGGFDGLDAFVYYAENELIPMLEAKEFDFKKYGDDVFALRLVYGMKGPKGAKTFDFKSGSIFDESGKRVYGRKKFREKQSWKPNTGKKRGR